MAIGVAVVGSGIFIREAHLPAIQKASNLDLKAIFSRSKKTADSLVQSASLSNVDVYSSDSDSGKQLPDLLKRDDISAVIIALPITSQPDYIKQCLSAGKHVLAEKPIAKDIASAQELIKWYHSNIDTKKINFSIAEQFRYLTRFRLGAKKVSELGRVLGFRLRLCALVEPGGKYISTSWREKPEHQGGFLLDGGVHFVAGIRMMLGSEARMARVSAFTAQLQEHLPPIDTVNAGVKLRNGASGTVAISFGTTFQGAEWTVACEKGTVEVDRGKVTVKKGDKEDVEECDDENGVNEEVKVWAESLESGKWDAMQSPEEALADLEVMESMFKSGEADGKPVDLSLQI